jgi:catechol 2,3-dioxygenase-like lactoylglutathione lyase family enzyme
MLMPRLKAIDHVGLKVSDLDRTLDFYERLGFTVLRTKGPAADGERSAVIQIGSQELNVFSHPAFAPASKENRVGMDHFCLEVEATSIEEVVGELCAVGIDIVAGPTKRRDGSSVFVHDPDGVRVELQLKNATTAFYEIIGDDVATHELLREDHS